MSSGSRHRPAQILSVVLIGIFALGAVVSLVGGLDVGYSRWLGSAAVITLIIALVSGVLPIKRRSGR